MPSYLTQRHAEDRLLARYGLEAELWNGHLEAASFALDAMGPFVGARYASTQTLAFPRSVTIGEDVEGDAPDAVLDWVSLEAYKLSRDDEPGISSVSVQHLGSKTFSRPKVDRATRLQAGLLTPYLRKTGVLG